MKEANKKDDMKDMKEKGNIEDTKEKENIEDMNKKNDMADINILLSNLTLLLSTVMSGLIPNALMKFVFIGCYMSGIIFYMKTTEGNPQKKSKNLSIFFTVAAVLILVTSTIYHKMSFGDYVAQIASFFHVKEDEEEAGIRANMKEIEAQLGALTMENKENLTELEERLNGVISEHLEVPLDGLIHEEGLHRLCKNREDAEEIQKIKEALVEMAEKCKKNFPELTTNGKQLELMYKMLMSSDLYGYYNIIKAFEDFGIDCDALEIDEYRLVLWDIQYVISIYQMRNSMVGKNNEYFEELHLNFQDFKADQLDEYDDQLNYQEWYFPFSRMTSNQIVERLDVEIVDCYKKFYYNFHTTS